MLFLQQHNATITITIITALPTTAPVTMYTHVLNFKPLSLEGPVVFAEGVGRDVLAVGAIVCEASVLDMMGISVYEGDDVNAVMAALLDAVLIGI